MIEEEVDKVELCGCKYTTTAPFCDKKTCEKLKETKALQTSTASKNLKIEEKA